ncbi:Sensor lytS [Gossypium arboreum]|uniref:Sensor lytS n=1 Tax=Gossypium arboreum TaxID=29729 RepID=A0A0B0MNC9_GOSAR|nr:Sensor lytS [Gossypium arboreum]
MPDSNKNQALDNIKERFALEVSNSYVKKALGKKWRDHKSVLKKEYFKKNINLEEKLRNVPPGMLRYQWEDAVRFWNSKKGEDRERVGTTSRQKQKFTHTTRLKSFACIVEDEEQSSCQKVRRLQLFDITYRKKDGSPMTTKAAEIMDKLKDKRAEYEAVASSDSSQYMPSSSQTQAKVQRLRDQLAQMQASTVEQIVQLKAEAAMREVEQSRKYDKLHEQLQNMMIMKGCI